jgi:hypothetical protein
MKQELFKPALIGSLALLVGAAHFFVYAPYIGPRANGAHDLQALTELLQIENRKKPANRQVENRSVTIPDLLSRAQELAAEHAVTLTGIEPVPGDPEQFKMSFAADFASVLEFLAPFEALQVSVGGFDIAPSLDHRDTLQVSLNFRHISTANPVGPEHVKQFAARLRAAALRDPFNPGAGVIRIAALPDSDDLTWTYHLTSISQIGKTRYATIDGRDYNVGDRIKGLVVSAIGNDNVVLLDKESDKARQRILKFRNIPRDRT